MVGRPQGNLNEKFDPDYVATLRKILDIAVEQIAQENRTPATKAKMAQTIVRRAADGITDANDLVSSAVRVGETRAALRARGSATAELAGEGIARLIAPDSARPDGGLDASIEAVSR